MVDPRRSVETEQLRRITDLAREHGLLLHHCRDSRHCDGDPGLPDVILVGPGGVMWRELKSSPHNMTRGQSDWKWALRAAGADHGIWLPSHLRNGTLDDEIAALARV